MDYRVTLDGWEAPLPLCGTLKIESKTVDSQHATEAGTVQRRVVRSAVRTVKADWALRPADAAKMAEICAKDAVTLNTYFPDAGGFEDAECWCSSGFPAQLASYGRDIEEKGLFTVSLEFTEY